MNVVVGPLVRVIGVVVVVVSSSSGGGDGIDELRLAVDGKGAAALCNILLVVVAPLVVDVVVNLVVLNDVVVIVALAVVAVVAVVVVPLPIVVVPLPIVVLVLLIVVVVVTFGTIVIVVVVIGKRLNILTPRMIQFIFKWNGSMSRETSVE